MDLWSGKIKLCRLSNVAAAGLMPVEKLKQYDEVFYEERTIGYNRLYTAQGANQQIDMLARIWENRTVKIGDYIILEDGSQYRINAIQHLLNPDGLKCTDITLEKLEDYFDAESD